MSADTLADEQLLDRLLALPEEQLSSVEREAFEGMKERGRPLSKKQRHWVQGSAERLGIQAAPSRNVFSSMPKAVQDKHKAQLRTLLPWELPGYKKAVRPPGKG